ncbi:hypothetical protein H0H81_006205 [Sphagnurus paluster]|uniref:Alcohol dehydrogenase-like N-terminal domain-containing protein n=1 Tax=Sphagnurus paluster TaxID=117069 RepID=A0A9P7GLQ8_9AGAR|nr:hypothetical protein H0H81_006205 [Sphagnurus paluster]
MAFEIPTTARAAVLSEFNQPYSLRTDYPVKQPAELAPGECLVKIEYSGVCHSDLHIKKGDWTFKPTLPLIGGHEGVGRVVAIGEHSDAGPIKLGDRVGLKWIADGLTVYKALKQANVKIGDWVAISGAGGGLGHLAVQYAVAMGLRVVAIDTGEAKKELCLKLGAEKWVDFRESTDLTKDVQAATDGLGPQGAIVATGDVRFD